jgi:hypothetical protein
LTELKEAFDELGAFIANYDPIALLSQLTATFLFFPEDEFQGEASDVVRWQRRIELLAGYFAVRPYPSGRTAVVDGDALGRVERLVDQYLTAVAQGILAEGAKTGKKGEGHVLLAQAKIESLYVRGDAYPHQFYAFAQELYGPHDAWFREHCGFCIADGVILSQAIFRLYSDRFTHSLRSARERARKLVDDLVAQGEVAENERKDAETQVGCALHFGRSEEIFGFTVEDLSQFSNIQLETCRSFLDRMSQQFGYHNPKFPDSFTNPAAAPWDYNTLHERPIMERAGKHWLFVPPLLPTAVFTTFYFDLMQDRGYRSTFEKARGKFVEYKTAECLRRVFPARAVVLNPTTPKGEELTDVIVLHDHKILLFQCKAKTLTYPARIGEDLNALKTDVKKAIADAFGQGIKARGYLLAYREPKIVAGTETLGIDMTQVNEVLLVSVTAMPFQTFASRLANSNVALGLFSEDEYPWSLSLGDFDILTQVLGSPAEFLHYVLRRRQVERTAFEVHADEMDYLGFYLSQGLCFDTNEFQDLNLLDLSGMSNDIDRWVYERFQCGRDVNPPRPPMPDGFLDFLREVERTGSDYRTDCALALLDHGGPARSRFMEMIAQTKDRCRKDRSLHSFSAVMKGGKRGVSFVTLDANRDRDRLFSQAAAFAMLKKYDSKCDEWAGFGWDLASAHTVDVAFFVSQPWTYDEQLERMAKEKLRPGQRLDL